MSRSRSKDAPSDNFYVSLNDVLVGILFLFIMLLMTYALNFKKRADKFDQVYVQRVKERTDLLKLIARQMGNDELGQPRATVKGEDGILRLNAALLFENNQATLKPRGEVALHKLAGILEHQLPCYVAEAPQSQCNGTNRKRNAILEAVYIEGHTDKNEIHKGAYADNWELSSARAIAAYRALTYDKGADRKSLLEKLPNARGKENLVGVSAYADTRKIDDINDAPNRRVDFRFILSAPTKSELDALKSTAK